MKLLTRVPGLPGVFLILLAPLACTSQAANVLFIDDSRGQSIQSAWITTLNGLGHSVTTEAIPAAGNPTVSLSGFDVVIWSVGDRAYENLTVANWSTMTQYVNGGGKLVYAGGHSVYEEYTVGHAAIENFFGVSGTFHNMPMWGANTSISGSGGSSPFGTSSFAIVQSWSGGEYGNMFSGFGVSNGTALVNQPIVTNGAPGPYVVAQNSAANAQIWGLDLNHIAEPDREAFLGYALQAIAIPEPSCAVLMSLTTLGLLGVRRRIQ